MANIKVCNSIATQRDVWWSVAQALIATHEQKKQKRARSEQSSPKKGKGKKIAKD